MTKKIFKILIIIGALIFLSIFFLYDEFWQYYRLQDMASFILVIYPIYLILFLIYLIVSHSGGNKKKVEMPTQVTNINLKEEKGLKRIILITSIMSVPSLFLSLRLAFVNMGETCRNAGLAWFCGMDIIIARIYIIFFIILYLLIKLSQKNNHIALAYVMTLCLLIVTILISFIYLQGFIY